MDEFTVALIAQVRRLVEESGDISGFDPEAWTIDWLNASCPALGGRAPKEFVGTEAGRAVVTQRIAQMQSGAFS
jgi:uncharacterized protein (DUF2384 family)